MMEKWEKNIKKYPWHLLIALFALLGQGMWLCGSCEAVPLDGKWKYYESGHIEPNMVTLTNLNANMMYNDKRWKLYEQGSQPELRPDTNCIILSTRLPKVIHFNSPVLFFVTENQSVRVFLDDDMIYDSQDVFRGNHINGTRWHMVNLPSSYPGGQVSFQVYSEKQEDLFRLQEISVDDSLMQTQRIFQHDSISILMIFFSIVVLVMLAMHYWIEKNNSQLSHVAAILFILIGIVRMAANSWTVFLLYDNLSFWYYISLLMLYVQPLPLMFMVYQRLNGRFDQTARMAICGGTIIPALAVVLDLSDIAGLERVLTLDFMWNGMSLVMMSSILWNSAWHDVAAYAYNVRLAVTICTTAGFYIAYFLGVYFHVISLQSPWGNVMLVPVLVSILYMINRIIREENRLKEENKQLEQEVISEKHKAQVDPLTRSFTRIKMAEVMSELINAAEDSKLPFAMMMMDIDKFKSVNDTYGHAAGDRVLVGMADIVRRNLDARHTFIRYGGEEFMVICSMYTLTEAWELAEKIRTDLEKSVLLEGRQITCSIGVSYWHIGGNDSEKAMQERADKALYYAKNHGRNQCVMETVLTDAS